jgi:hypothetical protein
MAELSWTRERDRLCGPFLFASERSTKGFAFVLSSADEGNPAHLRITGLGGTVMVRMPRWLVRPFRDDYEVHSREYGCTLYDGHFCLRYGPQTWASNTTASKGWFLPWTQWRYVETRHYDFGHCLIRSFPSGCNWHEHYEFRQALPTKDFEFDDFDSERIVCKTRIEEMRWKFGTGWFKWLSLFRKDKVRRSLELEFSKETGRRKGSWKGGTVGHAIDMLPGEPMEAAFQRYCDEHEMTFVGEVNVGRTGGA